MAHRAKKHGMLSPNRKNTAKLVAQGHNPNQTNRTTNISKPIAEDAASKQDNTFMKENNAEAPSPSDPRSRT